MCIIGPATIHHQVQFYIRLFCPDGFNSGSGDRVTDEREQRGMSHINVALFKYNIFHSHTETCSNKLKSSF